MQKKYFLYIATFLILSLSGCTNLFFFPDSDLAVTPKLLGLEAKDIELQQADNKKIFGWYLKAIGPAKGTVLFFHGNAQNISTHIGSVYWLPKAGFNVVMVDYQGFGISEGNATVATSLEDIKLVVKSFQTETRPLIVYGQSIGAALCITALAELNSEGTIDAAIFESSFASYQQIAREKLASLWVTWPLQYPLSLFISDRYAPIDHVENLPKIPLLFIHSKSDQTIEYHHTKDLFELANEPKELWTLEGVAHIRGFQNPESRARFIEYLERVPTRVPQ